MARIDFHDVTCHYQGTPNPAVDQLQLEVQDGEFLVLVGPSGCGKSTSLRLLAGLEQATKGTIYMDSDDVTRLSPKDRDIAMVFQSYALYPNMTVGENIEFPLKVAKVPTAERRERARDVAEMLDLGEYLKRKPRALSGGQRQRVAMGRAIVRRPRAFLLDEPLSNLDAKLRVQTRTQIAALQRRLEVTTVYVTHDQVEAMTMGDRVAVMRDGVLQQCAAPQEIYRRPANTFVAGFVGSPPMNLVTTALGDGEARLGPIAVPVPRAALQQLGDEREVVVGLRPDALRPVAPGAGGLELEVDVVEVLGVEAYAYCRATIGGEEHALVVRVDPLEPPAKGDRLTVEANPDAVHLFSARTQERLTAEAAR
jgi:multiple sugar transport system ATP-binding protein